jgi:glycosyltransferase involved in cell wall biosynthesis
MIMKTSRIIYLVGAYPQWSETFVRQDLALLQELDLPLYPVALFPGDTQRAPEWPEVSYLASATGPAVLAGPQPPSAWGQVLPRFVSTRLSLFRHRSRVRALVGLARSVGAEHIHAEFADLPALVASAAARRLRLGYSVSVHARDVHLAKFDPGLIYGRARFIVACNRDAWRGVNKFGSAAKAGVHLIHHGLDLSAWHHREPPARGANAPLRMLFVGRFVEKKGLNVLLRAMARLREMGETVRLSLFGSGPMQTLLEEMGRELGLGEAMDWRGVVSREEIAREMQLHDLLVMPSVVSHEGDRDGVPNVVLEAMASGTPVVGSDAGSLPEVLTERTGWVFPAGDDGAMAEVIDRFRSLPGEVRSRSNAARQMVVRDFDARVLARRRAALLQSVLSP